MARRVSQITVPIAYAVNRSGIKKAESAFGKFGTVVGAVAAASVAAVAGIGTAAVRMASEFEDSFAKIEGLVGVSKAQLGELEEAARRLGPQFGKSANEAADALFFITSAGLRGDAAINVLEASLKGAAIGLGETKTIADLATSAVNAYGESNLNGAQAVDVLTEAVRLGKLEPAELAGAMGQVLPLASNLGVSFAEVGAAMAGMSKTGTDASTAATQLRQILATIAKPTAEANRELANMGLSAEGLRDQIRSEGLYATLETLTTAFDGNIEATSAVFGNIRALSGVLDLMGASAEDNRILFAQMTDDVGVLDDALGVTADTASFKFDRAMQTARAALLPVGDTLLNIGAALLDSLMPTLEGLAPVFEEMFANLEEPLTQLVGVFPELLDAMLPVLPVLGDIAAIIADVLVAVMPILTALFDALIPIFEALIPPLAEFIHDLMAQLAPLLVGVIEAIAPLVEKLLPIFLTLWETLIPIVMEFIDAFMPILVELLPLLTSILELAVLPVLQMLADMMSVVLPTAFDLFAQLGLIPNVKAMEGWAGGIGKIVSGVRTFIANTMNGFIESLEGATNAAIDMVNKLLAAGRALPGAAGLLFKGVRDLAKVSFTRVTVPGEFDNLIFPDVDTTGISDVGRRPGMQGPSLANLYRNVDTSSLAGLRDLMTTRGFYTDSFGNTVFGNITPFANGGIVTGPTLGLIGEAGPEAIIPLDRADRMGNTYNITVNAGMGTDGPRVGEQIVKAIKRYERQSGPVFASA